MSVNDIEYPKTIQNILRPGYVNPLGPGKGNRDALEQLRALQDGSPPFDSNANGEMVRCCVFWSLVVARLLGRITRH